MNALNDPANHEVEPSELKPLEPSEPPELLEPTP